MVDERSRVIYTVARIEDPYALKVGDTKPLRVGTFVKANILGKETRGLVVLPRHILRAGSRLWVIDEQLTLRNRNVTTLRTEGDEVYVSSGLQQGDLVCLTNISGAVAGTPVRINSTTSTLRQAESVLEAASNPPSAEVEASDSEGGPDQTSANAKPQASAEQA